MKHVFEVWEEAPAAVIAAGLTTTPLGIYRYYILGSIFENKRQRLGTVAKTVVYEYLIHH